MRTRSETIQAVVLIASGAAVAAVGLWGRRLPTRATVTVPRRRRVHPSPVRWSGREILGADEALRRWDAPAG